MVGNYDVAVGMAQLIVECPECAAGQYHHCYRHQMDGTYWKYLRHHLTLLKGHPVFPEVQHQEMAANGLHEPVKLHYLLLPCWSRALVCII